MWWTFATVLSTSSVWSEYVLAAKFIVANLFLQLFLLSRESFLLLVISNKLSVDSSSEVLGKLWFEVPRPMLPVGREGLCRCRDCIECTAEVALKGERQDSKSWEPNLTSSPLGRLTIGIERSKPESMFLLGLPPFRKSKSASLRLRESADSWFVLWTWNTFVKLARDLGENFVDLRTVCVPALRLSRWRSFILSASSLFLWRISFFFLSNILICFLRFFRRSIQSSISERIAMLGTRRRSLTHQFLDVKREIRITS